MYIRQTNMEGNYTNYTETWTATAQTPETVIIQQYGEYLAVIITVGMMTLTSALLMLMNAFLLKDRSSFQRRFGNVENQLLMLTSEVKSLDKTRNHMLSAHEPPEDSLSSSDLVWLKYRLLEMQQCFDSVARNVYADRVATLLMGAKGDTPHDRLRNACLGQYELPQGDPEVLRLMLGVPVPVGYVLDDKRMDNFIGTYLPGVRKNGHDRFRHLLQSRVT